jgi:hypothetical protein
MPAGREGVRVYTHVDELWNERALPVAKSELVQEGP